MRCSKFYRNGKMRAVTNCCSERNNKIYKDQKSYRIYLNQKQIFKHQRQTGCLRVVIEEET